MVIHYEAGQKIGNCIYLKDVEDICKGRRAKFKCECGNEFIAAITHVKMLHTRSCGCIHSKQLSDRNTKHGLRYLVEYSLWLNMKQRCTNPKFNNYHLWGGRGITMCDRWLNSFENFYEDMGSQPAKRMGIDRIDNELGYYKDNCRWATPKEQNNNTRRNRYLTFNGITKSLSTWAEELGVNSPVARKRLERGYTKMEDIFSKSKFNNNGSRISR
jgi:hypothetical protein